MMRRAYQTDLSDTEWALIEPHLPAPRAPGRPRVHPLREILDAVFYVVVRGGCTWRLLPHDLERPGKPSTTISASGASMVLGNGCTRSYAGGRGYTSGETRSPVVLASWTAREREDHRYWRRRARLRPGQKKVKGRKRHLNLWTRRGWCSKRRSTRQTSSTLRRHKAAHGTR